MKGMRILILILLVLPLFAQQQPQQQPQFPSVNRKARQLTAQEGEDWRQKQLEATRANNELELVARRLCESVHVELSDCMIEQGIVSERPRPPVTPQSATPSKPQQTEPVKPTAEKPPAK